MAEPAAKPSAGSAKAEAAMAPAACVVSVIIRRRVTVSPSKAPGMLRSAVYFDCGCLRGSTTAAPNFIARRVRGGPPGRSGAPPPALGGLVVRCRTARHRDGAGLPYGVRARRLALRVRLRTEGDDVGQLDHRVEVAEGREALQPERVEAVPGQQRQVGILRARDAARGVVLEVALADGLDDQRVALARGVAVRLGGAARRHDGLGQQPALLAQRLREALQGTHATSAKAAAAASTVWAMWSDVCASEGNHASNCDAGG